MDIDTSWMSDVLSDLHSFCLKNGLEDAAQKLAETNEFIGRELGHDTPRLSKLNGQRDTPRF